jgi:hypothetical protein
MRFFHVPCIAILAIGLFLVAEQSLAAEPLQCGFATTDITPPVGYRMSGYFYERFSTGVASPLEAKCIVLQQGDVRMAWVFCDLVGLPAHVTSVVRDQASSKTGIPRKNIFIAGTHTHTGPLYFGPLRNYFHSQAVEKSGRDEHEAIDFPDTLRDGLVALIADAAAAAQPSELAVGMAELHGLSFNRRYVMRDGSVRTNPGKGNPDIVRPAGPVDPQVGVIQFRGGDKPVAGLTVFALHLDTMGGTDFARDFPLFLSESLRETYGDDYVSIFGLGTCGNINHFDLMNNRGDKGAQEAKRIGDTLASTVKSAHVGTSQGRHHCRHR